MMHLCVIDFDTLEERGDCPHVLHDWPLPDDHVAAHEVAMSRIAQGWRQAQCPDCGLYGWPSPPTPMRGTAENPVRVPNGGHPVILPVLLAQVAARWAHRQPPAHGWTPTESETEMTEANELQTAGNGCECWVVEGIPYIGIHTPGGPYEYNPRCPRHGDPEAPDVVPDPAPEQTYTRADMARAWAEGHRNGWSEGYDVAVQGSCLSDPNPYEQEEA